MQDKTSETSAPLRICLLSYRGNPTSGGQGVYIKRLSRALADLGHQVDVLSGPPYPELDSDIRLHCLPSLDLYNPDNLFRVPSPGELISPVNLLEWLLVCSGGFPEVFTFSIRAYGFLKKNSHRYDIVHDNQCLGSGLLGLKHLGLPLVTTIHHPITVDREIELKAQRWWWRRLKIRRWYSFLNMQIRVSKKLGHLITVSEASRRDISLSFGLPASRFSVVVNGINTNTFYPKTGITRKKNRIMVTNSADTPLKGLKYLIQAFADIRKDRKVELIVIGKPKKDGTIYRLCRDLNLEDSITFTGRIDDSEFATYYAECTMAVVPSVYEGFGLPAGEAMACRVPVISTTGGALPEVVGNTGILVPPRDSDAIKDAIIDLLDHPDKRRRLAQAGFQRALKHFTWRNTAIELTKIYQEAI